jgi:diapolycopene oxygenase
MKVKGSKLTVVVIGAGLGGMSAAIMLALRGFQVTILEKNRHLGGKLNLLETQGFRFDLGPSILTLPHVFRPLFEGDGKRLEDYIDLQRVDPQWRNFFEDGMRFDLFEDQAAMRAELKRLRPGAYAEFDRFIQYARVQYGAVERGYLREGLDTFGDLIRFYGLRGGFELDWRASMGGRIEALVKNPYLRAMFEYFIKYVGSSAFDAPGFMNLLPIIQLDYGLWYVRGGLYQLSKAFQRRLTEMNVDIRLSTKVVSIVHQKRVAHGVIAEFPNGTRLEIPADYVVSNMEIVPASEQLLGEPEQSRRLQRRFEPACSGIVLHLGLNRIYPQLAHHNFFYSANQRAHFHRVFREKRLPDDPTIYVVAPSRTDPSQAPAGCDNLKILPHIPPLNDKNPYTREDCEALKDICLDKLERMGLDDLRRHIVVEDFWSPFDIREKYASNAGSIYGVVCDRRRNFAFKAPKRSTRYRNLFFVGASVNPGAGMPMVSLCGQHVARLITKEAEAAFA